MYWDSVDVCLACIFAQPSRPDQASSLSTWCRGFLRRRLIPLNSQNSLRFYECSQAGRPRPRLCKAGGMRVEKGLRDNAYTERHLGPLTS